MSRPGSPAPAAGRPPGQSDVRVALLAAVTVLVLMVPVLRLWRADLHRSFYGGLGDSALTELAIDSTLDHGWYLHDPDLAAPAGGDLDQFPFAETLPLLVVRGFDVLQVDEPAAAINLLYLASFPAVALVAAVGFRRLGASAPTAVAAGVLYTFLPYHFVRNEVHLFLAIYVAAPMLGVLLVETLRGRPVLRWRGGWGRTLTHRRNLVTIALALLIGLTSVYYAAFAMLLLPIAGGLRGVADRRWRTVVPPLVAAAACLLATAPMLLPGALERLHDEPRFHPTRAPGQSELLALRLVDLVLPVTEHVIEPLGDLSRRVREGTFITNLPEVENSASLGAVATVGFLLLALTAVRRLLVPGGTGPEDGPADDGIDAAAAAGAGLVFLTATVGGVSALVAYLVTDEVRAWSRLSVLLAFFCLLAIARALDRARSRLARWPAAFPAVVVAVVVVGMLDQAAPSAFVPPYETAAADAEAIEALAVAVAADLPDGTDVLQLPFVSFPEQAYVATMPMYAPLHPTVFVDSLRWSTGAVAGTAEDWAGPLVGADVETQLLAGAAVGFDAAWVDLRGFDDPSAALATLEARLGPPDHTSTVPAIVVWDLRPHVARLRVDAEAAAAQDPVLREAIDAALAAA